MKSFICVVCAIFCLALSLPAAELPAKQDDLASAMLAWRDWLRQQETGPEITIKESCYLGPLFGKELAGAGKALAEWTENETAKWKKFDLIFDRPSHVMRSYGRGESRLLLQLDIESAKAGSQWIALEAGQQVDMLLNGRPVTGLDLTKSADLKMPGGGGGLLCGKIVVGQLELAAGSNRLLISALKHEAYQNIVPTVSLGLGSGLWKKTVAEFPDQTGFLEAVDGKWLNGAGWYGAVGVELETSFVKQQIAALGDDPGATQVSAALAELVSAKAGDQDARWLHLTLTSFHFRFAVERLRSTAAAIARMASAYPGAYPSAAAQSDLKTVRAKLSADLPAALTKPGSDLDLAAVARLQNTWLVKKHPKLAGQKILFLKRQPYAAIHYYDFFQNGVQEMGSDLCLLDIDSGAITSILPTAFRGGWIDHYDLDFDARRIVFSYRPPDDPMFCLYEMNLADGAVRRLTTPQHATPLSGGANYKDGEGDLQPCFLADGGIVFASTRANGEVYCTPGHLKTTALYRLDPADLRIEALSPSPLHELAPTILDDGRILYNRFEYVYKNVFRNQPLCVMRPDGTGFEEIYGGQVSDPPVVIFGRQIPGAPSRIVAVGCGHERYYHGSIGILDVRENKRAALSWRSLTPEVRLRSGGYHQSQKNRRWTVSTFAPLFGHPWPLDDASFVVSYNPGRHAYAPEAFGLALIDIEGNRVMIYDDSTTSCWNPMIFAARKRPRILPRMVSDDPSKTGTLFVADVYQGLEGIPCGEVKYIRVLEQVKRPWQDGLPDARGDMGADHKPIISMAGALWVTALHGVVPVNEDGSAVFEVLPDRNIFFQALDKDFKSLHTMRTWITMRPGEKRSCVGCHEHRSLVPPVRPTTAMGQDPGPLQLQPGDSGPRAIHYPVDVQPIWDRHCISCHQPGCKAAKLDLRDTPVRAFSESYIALINSGSVDFIQEFGASGLAPEIRQKIGKQQYNRAESIPLKSWGALPSKLVGMLEKGHGGVKLSPEEMIRVITWLDADSPFYGTYLGIRNPARADRPTWRLAPDFEAATKPLEYIAQHPELYPKTK